MNFRTVFSPIKADFTLSPERPVVALGSCFADYMSARMRQTLWNVVNPLGTLYNPRSIANALEAAVCSEDKALSRFRDSLFIREGIVHSWMFDSRISCGDTEQAVCRFLHMRDEMQESLQQAGALFVTFGTAWIYQLADRHEYIVANCHKMPSAGFVRRRMGIDEIAELWGDLANRLASLYPNLRIIFTVSPVRHIKDGFEGNARSKATLLLAVEKICADNTNCSYFPAYEIVNDDLRDYRFYASDMIHPSTDAVEYLWDIVCHTYLDADGIELLCRGEALRRAFAHRPLVVTDKTVIAEEQRLARLRQQADDFATLHPLMLSPC